MFFEEIPHFLKLSTEQATSIPQSPALQGCAEDLQEPDTGDCASGYRRSTSPAWKCMANGDYSF